MSIQSNLAIIQKEQGKETRGSDSVPKIIIITIIIIIIDHNTHAHDVGLYF